jgi:hypothetical protein
MVWESIGYQATAAATTGTAATAFSGDSLNIKNAIDGTKISLLSAFSKNQTLGAQQIVAPSFSDTTRGIRWVAPAALTAYPFRGPMVQPLTPQELISATIIGTAVAGDIEQGILSIYYENSPGLNGKYMTPEDVMSQGVRSVTVQCSVTATAAGGWTGAELITADSDLLRANTPYAVIGGAVGIQVTAVGLRAPDWSNLRVAFPGDPNMPDETNNWFALLSKAAGMPLIPTFNSANKNNIFVDVADDENGGATTLQLNLVELPKQP